VLLERAVRHTREQKMGGGSKLEDHVSGQDDWGDQVHRRQDKSRIKVTL
jgi:hypothetical protein